MRSRRVTGGFPLGFMKIRLKFHELFVCPLKQGAWMETWEVLPPSGGVREVFLDVVE